MTTVKSGLGKPVVFLALALFLSAPGRAGTVCVGTNWAAGSGLWSVNANWNPAAAPNGGANVCLTNGGNAFTTLDGSFTIGNLTIGSANRFDLSGGNSLFFEGNVVNAGTLNVNSGGLFGIGAGGGSYTQSGGATTIAGTGALIVGTYNQSGGTTTVNGLLSASTSFNITGGTLQGTGNVALPTGGFSIIGSGATLLPGSPGSPGALNFNGLLELQSGSVLDEGITGLGAGQYGVTAVTGEPRFLKIDTGAILNVSASPGVLDGSVSIPVGSQLNFVTANILVGGYTSSQLTGDVTFDKGLEYWTVSTQGNNQFLTANATGPVTATWSGPSGSWAGTSITTGWSCNPAFLSGCVPNNTGNLVYDVVLNSPGQQLALDATAPATVNINSLTLTAGTLSIAAGQTLNLANQPNGITDINASSALILNGTLTTGAGVVTSPGGIVTVIPGVNGLSQLTSIEGSLTLNNGQALTITPIGGTLAVNGGTLNAGIYGTTVTGNLTETGNAVVTGAMTISGSLTIGPSASLNGSITAASVVNNGQATGAISLGTFTNNGQAQNITSNDLLTNSATGRLTALGSSSGIGGVEAANGLNNQGVIQVTSAFDGIGTPHTTLSVTGDFNNQPGATVQMNGTASSIRVSGAFNNTGIVTLSGAKPTLTVTGNYTQSGAGSTEIDQTAVLNAGSYIQSGAATTTIMGTISSGGVTIMNPGTLNTDGFSQSGGTTTVNGVLAAATLTIAGGTLQGTGTVSIPNGSVATVANGGALLPGVSTTSPGTINFNGSLELQNGSVLSEGIAGTGAGQYGVTAVNTPLGGGSPGTLQVDSGALLNLSVADGIRNGSTLVPVGQQLTIMAAGALSGGYTNAQLTGDVSFNNGLQRWTISNQGDNEVLLSSATAPVTATWSGPSGSWSANTDPTVNTGNTNWTCSLTVLGGCVPNNTASALYNAVINSPGQQLTVDSGPVNINALSLKAGALTIAAGYSLNLIDQANGITDINANSVLIVNGTFTAGGAVSALSQLTSVEGSLTLNNGQPLTITPIGGTLAVNGGTLNAGIYGTTVTGNLVETGSAVVTGAMTISGSLTVGPSASLSGVITAASVINNGQAAGVTSLGTFTNNGQAQNIISNDLLTNSATGRLIALGDPLGVAGAGALNGLNNQGVIQVTGGGQNLSGRPTLGVTGDLDNQAGASVQINGSASLVRVSGAFNNMGNVTLSGGQGGANLTVTGNYTQSGAGATEVDQGTTLRAAQININGGTLSGLGTIQGNTSIASGAVLSSGYVTAGTPFALTLDALTLNGTLQETLNSIGFGTTVVSGALVLNSTTSILNIVQDSSYNPAPGTTLQILSAGSISGTFSSIQNDFFNGNTEKWNVVYGSNGIELQAASAVRGMDTATWFTASSIWTAPAAFNCFPSQSSCVPNNDGVSDYQVILNSPVIAGVEQTLTIGVAGANGSFAVDSVVQLSGNMLIVSGSTLSAASYLANGDEFLTVDGVLNADTITLANGATLNGDGSITRAVTVSSEIAPGALDVTGNLTLTSSANYAEFIAGDSSFGELFVTGPATLNGNLDIELEGSYDPAVGTTFQFLYAPGYSGSFASVDLNGSTSLLFNSGTEQFRIIYNASGVELLADVAGADPSQPISGQTPEPASILLVAAAIAGYCFWRRH